MRWVLMEAIMRAWILAAVAALAVGQAEAATVTHNTGPLYLTEKCLAMIDEPCSYVGQDTWAMYGVVEWSADFLIDETKIVWADGVGTADYFAIKMTGLRLGIGGQPMAQKSIKNLTIITAIMTFDPDMNVLGISLMTELLANQDKWYFDTMYGHSYSLLWVNQRGYRYPRFYQFDNERDPLMVSPLPLPATAPLMGAALIGLGIARRRRA